MELGSELVRAYANLKSPEPTERPVHPVFSADTPTYEKFHAALCYEAQSLFHRISPGGRLLAWVNCILATVFAGAIGFLTMFLVLCVIILFTPVIALLFKLVFVVFVLLFAYLSLRAMLFLRQ